jgi:hypothetical protein
MQPFYFSFFAHPAFSRHSETTAHRVTLLGDRDAPVSFNEFAN